MIRSQQRYLPLSFATIVFFLVACGGKKNAPAPSGPPPPVEVDAIVIKPETFSYSTEASGTVIASEFVELKPEVSGRIVQLHINEGEQVAEGSLLAKLNDEDLQAQLRKYQSQQDIAVKTQERLKKLLDVNGLNQQEYDVSVNQVSSLQADIDYTKAQIRKTEVRAPFSGLIGLRNVSNGAFVTSAQVLATLQQVNALKIDFVLPEAQAATIKNGNEVTVRGANGVDYKAKVMAIEPQINAGTRNVKVRAIVQDKVAGLSPGAFVTVLVQKEQNDQAILIPTHTIIPESRNKKVALIKNGMVKFQVIETGYRSDDRAEVLSGLSVGDTIATSGLLFLKPNSAVKLRSIQ